MNKRISFSNLKSGDECPDDFLDILRNMEYEGKKINKINKICFDVELEQREEWGEMKSKYFTDEFVETLGLLFKHVDRVMITVHKGGVVITTPDMKSFEQDPK